MTMQEALTKWNYYLSIFLMLSIVSVYTGQSLEFIKTHFIIMILLELAFVFVSSIILYRLFYWCYKNKKPGRLFKYLKNRHIKSARKEFDKLFEQKDASDTDYLIGYIDNATNSLKTNNNGGGYLALKQFLEWVDEDDSIQLYIYNKLAESLKSISDDQLISQTISVICVYNKKLKKDIKV